MTAIQTKTIAIRPGTAAALAWVLREEIDIATERSHGLQPIDAKREYDDLVVLRALLLELGGDPKDLVAIDADLAALSKELDARDPRAAIEARALADYDAVAGQVVFCTEVECYDAQGGSVTAHCEPPAIVRVRRFGSEREMRDNVLRWTDDRHCDPHYDIEILDPHAAFAGLRPSWIYGTCRSVEGHVEPAPIRPVDEMTRILYVNAEGLSDEQVALPSGPTP